MIRYQDDWLTVFEGDLRRELAAIPAGSVQTVVTSPPYYQTRDYGTTPQVWGGDPDHDHTWQDRRRYAAGGSAYRDGGHVPAGPDNAARVRAARWYGESVCDCGAWLGDLGREPHPDDYAAHLVEAFRAVHRVLADDGTVWLNLGDCTAGSGYSNHRGTGQARRAAGGRQRHVRAQGIRTKNLLLVPFRAALALQADGWLLRQCVIWQKDGSGPQPSVTDRPWTTHEYVFLLAKRGRYRAGVIDRSVWTYPVGRYPGHHAVMPQALAARCIDLTSRPGDVVLDPFGGAGTTASAAIGLGRRALVCDLLPAYVDLMLRRLAPAEQAAS